MIEGYLNQTCQRVVEAPSILYDDLIPANGPLVLTGSAPTEEAFYVKVTDSYEGAAHTGTVVIVGLDDLGDPLEETLTFTFARWKKTTNSFSSITQISTNNLVGDHLLIECVDTLGDPIYSESLVDLACRWEDKVERYIDEDGNDSRGNAKVMVAEPIDLGENLVYGGRRYSVVSKRPAVELGGSEDFRTLVML